MFWPGRGALGASLLSPGGRLRISLAMIAIWLMAQTASYGTTQTVVLLQTQSSP